MKRQAEQVVIGIETDRGPWVQALLAAGYRVVGYQSAAGGPLPRAAQRLGRQSDPTAARTLADMVRTDQHQLRPIAGDSEVAKTEHDELLGVLLPLRDEIVEGESPQTGRRFLTPTGLRRELRGAAREEGTTASSAAGVDSTPEPHRRAVSGWGATRTRPPLRQSAARRCAGCCSAQLRSRPASTAAWLISGCLVAVSSVNCRSLARPRRCASASARRGACSSSR
jgi:hypothetical protein